MSLIAIDVKCSSEKCGEIHDLLVPREERNEIRECPACGEPASRVFVRINNKRVTYHDGIVRQDLRDLAQASRLESEAFSMPVEERGEISKEINKLRSTKK